MILYCRCVTYDVTLYIAFAQALHFGLILSSGMQLKSKGLGLCLPLDFDLAPLKSRMSNQTKSLCAATL